MMKYTQYKQANYDEIDTVQANYDEIDTVQAKKN